MRKACRMALWAAAVACVLGGGNARATTMIFTTGLQTVNGSSINATASFDFTAGAITVTLLNNIVDPGGPPNLIAAVDFTLSMGGATPNLVTTDTFSAINVDKNGNPSVGTSTGAWLAPTFTLASPGPGKTGISLCALCPGAQSNQPGPAELIIGAPNSSGVYGSAGGGIKNNSGHNPFILGSGGTPTNSAVLSALNAYPTFVITVPNMPATVTVSSVIFHFGTGGWSTAGTTYEQDTFTTPEPGPLFSVLGGLGLIGLGVWKRRKA